MTRLMHSFSLFVFVLGFWSQFSRLEEHESHLLHFEENITDTEMTVLFVFERATCSKDALLQMITLPISRNAQPACELLSVKNSNKACSVERGQSPWDKTLDRRTPHVRSRPSDSWNRTDTSLLRMRLTSSTRNKFTITTSTKRHVRSE